MNFNDVQNLKSDTKKLEALLDSLYDQFTKKAQKHVAPSMQSQGSTPSSADSSPYLKFLGKKWPWLALLLVLVSLSVGLSIGLALRGQSGPSGPDSPIWYPPDYVGDSTSRKALRIFYETMGGDYWTVKTNWMSEKSVCDWYGVTCREPYNLEYITALNLPNNNISGGLNGQEIMYNVATLYEVDLSRNDIGFGIAKLSPYIQKINLSQNKISDDIKKFNQLMNIKSLNLAYNRFFGEFQFSAGQLADMKELNLSHCNSLSGIAPIEGDFAFDVCDWSGIVLPCPIPDWVRKCGGRCF